MKFKLNKMGLSFLIILNMLISSLLFGADTAVTNSASFSFPIANGLDVNTSSGSLTYKKQLMHIPGKNGLDVDVSLIYNSSCSNDVHEGETNGGWDFSIDKIKDNMLYLADGSIVSLESTANKTSGEKVMDFVWEKSDNSSSLDGVVKYKNGITKIFSSGHLIKETDRFGNTISYLYDRHGRINQIIDTYGNMIHFAFNKGSVRITHNGLSALAVWWEGKLRYVIDTVNRTTSFGYVYSRQGYNSGNDCLSDIIETEGISKKIKYREDCIYRPDANLYITRVASISEKDDYSDMAYHELSNFSYTNNHVDADTSGKGYGMTINFPQRGISREYAYNSKHTLLSETLIKKAFATTPVDRVVMKKTYKEYYKDDPKYPLNIVTEYSTDYDYLIRILSFSSSGDGGGVAKNISRTMGAEINENVSPNITKSVSDQPLSWSSDAERIATRKVEETYTYDTYGNKTSEKVKDYQTGSSVTKAYQYFYHSSLYFYDMLTSISSSNDSASFTDINDAGRRWYGKGLTTTNPNTIIKKVDNYPHDNLLSTGATIEYGDRNYKRLTVYTYNADGRVASQTIKENNQPGLNIAGILADNSEKVVTNFYYCDNNNGVKHSIVTEAINKDGSSIVNYLDYDLSSGKILREHSITEKVVVPTVYERITRIVGYQKKFRKFKIIKVPLYRDEIILRDSTFLRINNLNNPLSYSEYKYDSLGRLIESRKKGETKSTKFTYTNNVSIAIGAKTFRGNSTVMVLPNGYTTIEIYNGHGKLLAKGEKLKETDVSYKLLLENQYKDEGELLISSFDANGNKTDYLYDYLFRNVGVRNPDETTKFSIIDDGKNRLINIDEERITKLTDYDEFGKVLAEYDCQNKTNSSLDLANLRKLAMFNANKVNEYDSIGNLIEIRQLIEIPGIITQMVTQSFKYDPLGRLLAVKLPSMIYAETLDYLTPPLESVSFEKYNTRTASAGVSAYSKYFYTYDLLGNVIEKSYDKNSSNDFNSTNKKIIDKLSYDYRGNLLTNIYGDKNEYDYFGRLAKKTDSKGQVFTYTYYDNNLVKSMIKDDIEIEKYTYDDNQQILTKEAKNKAGTWDILKYEYKTNGLTESISFNDTKTNIYEYDENNLVKSMIDAKGNKTEYSYDSLKRVTNISQANENIVYNYFNNGAVKSVTQGSNTESYTYNDKGLLQSLSFNNEKMYNYSYDDFNNISKKDDYVNKETTFYTYSKENKLVESTTFELGNRNFKLNLGKDANNSDILLDYSGSPLFKKAMKYKYTDFGDIEKVISFKNSVDALNIGNFKIEEGKVTVVDYGNVVKSSDETYSYSERDSVDPAYKGKTVPEILTKYAKANYSFSEGTNATASLESNIQYAYDLNGNLIKEDNVGKIKEYTYDAYNKLTTFKDADNKTAEYTYYPDGMRKLKSFDGKTTTFYYDNQNIIGEEVGTEYTSNIFGPTGIIARKVQNKNIMFFIKDAHSDIIRTVGEDGTALVTTTPVIPTPTSYPAIISNTPEVPSFNEGVMKTVSTYKYEDYGKVIDNKGAIDNPFRYSGEYTDDETGFQYLRARYYNPNIRRFITEDTYTGEITNPLTLNLYGYCAGNPIMYSDPSGHKAIEIVRGGIALDLGLPDPSDLVPQKWLGYGTVLIGAYIYDTLYNKTEDTVQTNKEKVKDKDDKSKEKIEKKDPASANSLQQEVKKGRAPRDIERVDKGHVKGQEDHVHYKDGTSSTVSGKIHDKHKGIPEPKSKTREWLEKKGWLSPN